MPIGKNSIKRVANNGYSNLKSSSPDMENSTVVEKITSPEEAEEVVVIVKPAKTKKSAVSKQEEKIGAIKAEVEKMKAKRTRKKAEPAPEVEENDGFVRVGLGEDLPTYLL